MWNNEKRGDWLAEGEVGYTSRGIVHVDQSPVGTYALHMFAMMDLASDAGGDEPSNAP